MKITSIIIGIGLLLSTTIAAAQMGGHGSMMNNQGGMSCNQQYHDMRSQRSSQMMGQKAMGEQMVRQGMMRDMHRMMSQMAPMMQTMAERMNNANRQDMSKFMSTMGDNMEDMSHYMGEGKMPDKDAQKRMQERIHIMNELVEKTEAN